MDIKQTADELGISVRHVRRLIKSGQLPAKKVRVQKTITVDAWEIPDNVVRAANESLDEFGRHENFGEWMVETADRLGLTMQDLSKRTKLTVEALGYVARSPGLLSHSNQDIAETIGKVLLRVDIERRCADG